MGGMAGFIPLRVGGAADGRVALLRLVPAAPGAMCTWGRIRTFGSGQVDMAGGLGMVGGHLCACGAVGSSLDVVGLKLAV